MPSDRYFSPDPAQRRIAQRLYASIAELPILSPHGHVDPNLFADPDATFGDPTELIILPDHYVFRMLYSQGVPLEALGIPRQDGEPVESDHRRIWQIFAEHFYLFRGTPTGIWLQAIFQDIFGLKEKLTGENAQAVYDHIQDQLASPAFRPRRLFHQFNIQVLCTTDFATDSLDAHRAIQASDWPGDVRPTFRPDDLLQDFGTTAWRTRIQRLSEWTGVDVHSYATFIQAIQERRSQFQALGATATDHDIPNPYTEALSPAEAETIFQRALRGHNTQEDSQRFFAHMLMEFARMSLEDGLVMQWHVGSFRNHNRPLYERFGPNHGSDIPLSMEFTRNLRALLNTYGNHPQLTLIIFTLDESTYSRELAPLAGHYPALKLGSPWWFHDSLNGMRRYFDRVMETAGIYNTAGFVDDARSFLSLPVRHEVWRRASADWLAGLVVRSIIDEEDALDMARALAYDLPKTSYHL